MMSGVDGTMLINQYEKIVYNRVLCAVVFEITIIHL